MVLVPTDAIRIHLIGIWGALGPDEQLRPFVVFSEHFLKTVAHGSPDERELLSGDDVAMGCDRATKKFKVGKVVIAKITNVKARLHNCLRRTLNYNTISSVPTHYLSVVIMFWLIGDI